MLVPRQFVIYGDAEDLGGMHEVQGVVSDVEGWELGGGGGEVEEHHHCLVGIEGYVIGVLLGE